jgi:hypothetical protein
MTRQEVAKRIEKRDSRQNGMKTVCTSAVLNALNADNWHYSQNKSDMLNILRRSGYAVRSRKSQLTKKIFRVSHIKNHVDRFSKLNGKFIVFVERHVLLLDENGQTIVDTDPRIRDKRKIKNIYEVAIT